MNGGRRPGAGRPKGAICKSTRAILEALSSEGEMPIQYMLRVMRDEEAPDLRRDDMAKTAARYLRPQIAKLPEDAFEEPVVEGPPTESEAPAVAETQVPQAAE
jgi:hypothetical protein